MRGMSMNAVRALGILAAFSVISFAEIIDRIAITVGSQVITESQIEDEIRVTAFLNREKLELGAASNKAAAGRLIEQALIRREMDLSKYPLPELDEASAQLQSIKAAYRDEAAYQAGLESYGITADDLARRLQWQLTLLRFIDYRFRPGIQIPSADVQAYYRQQVSGWEQKGTRPIPTLEESRDQIEEILTQKRIDALLDQWITETRTQVRVAYLDKSLE